MNPVESKKFVRILLLTAIIWFLLGVAFHYSSPLGLEVFARVFLWSFLDVVFMTALFWMIFFVPLAQRGRSMQILFFGFFKLVCLGFLAMILRRFRDAPISSLLMGIAFIGIGPLVAGVFSRSKENS